jgi:polysaccharide export outer membrane protein
MILKIIRFSFIILVFSSLLTSCKNINSNALFKIPKDGSFTYDSLKMNPDDDYRLGPGDRFSFVFATNDGERIVFSQSGIGQLNDDGAQSLQMQNRFKMDYLVRQNGIAELPLVGEMYVRGLSIVELEDTISKKLQKDFLDPFVQIKLTNQRVIVFPGRGNAQVIYLSNTNTSLLEVIAMAGGISDDGRANSVKIMRRTKGKREIYKVDLSTIDGLSKADMIVQGNDYIYIGYKPRLASSIFKEVGPWLSLMTTSLAVISIFRN